MTPKKTQTTTMMTEWFVGWFVMDAGSGGGGGRTVTGWRAREEK